MKIELHLPSVLLQISEINAFRAKKKFFLPEFLNVKWVPSFGFFFCFDKNINMVSTDAQILQKTKNKNEKGDRTIWILSHRMKKVYIGY